MTALNRKLFRDLSRMKGQGLAICAVMACGVATFVMSLTTLKSLEASQALFYAQHNFGQIFAHVKRAPLSVAADIARIDGVAQVQARIVADVTLDVPGMNEPALGRLISVPGALRPTMNGMHLRRGRWIEPGRSGEALISEAFADAHALSPGDSLSAVLNGRFKRLRIVGVVLSPEYVLSVPSGLSLPDDKRFGVLWIDYDELASAFDMDGAFNDLSLTLSSSANEPAVIAAIDRITEPYGGVGAYGRQDQVSNRFLSDEIRSLRGMGMIIPSIFLAVAAFLLNVVMSRLISTQREQIAALKAFGYSKLEVGTHYVHFVLVISLIGALGGGAAGIWLAGGLTGMYARFYRFPTFVFDPDPGVLLLGLAIACAAALAGTLAAVLRAVRLPAAEAMRPEPPGDFRPTIVERLGLQRLLGQPARMVLRQLERRPTKAAMSVLGIAMSVAVLVLGSFFEDALNYIIQFSFYTQQRQDVIISFVEPASSAAMFEVRRMPGVLDAEPMRTVPVRLSHRNIARRGAIMGLDSSSRLFRVIDQSMRPVPMPPDGLLISDMLAKVLDVSVGQSVWVEIMEGERRNVEVGIAGVVTEFAGLNAYMSLDALHRLMREGNTLSGAAMQVDARRMDELYRQLKQTPRVASVSIKESMVQSFNQTQAENQRAFSFFNIIFACIIAVGVVYNTARISLSERSRELATLRVVGFTRGEISAILLGELATLTVAALPVGMVLGYGFAWMAVSSFNSESFRIPLVITPRTYGFAAAVVIAAATFSGLLVRRKLDHLDLVSVLKSKE